MSVLSFLFVACGGTETISTPNTTIITPPVIATQETEQDITQEVKQQNPSSKINNSVRFEYLELESGLSQNIIAATLQDSLGYVWLATDDGLIRYDGYDVKIFRPEPDDPNSLSDRWVTSLYEDSQGYLWIGTRLGGINRYDPKTSQFTYYVHNPNQPTSLVSNQVNTMLVDSQGFLWVGTNKGLNRLDQETGEFKLYRANPNFLNSLSSDKISALFEDSRGILWVGTSDGGLNRFHAGVSAFTRYQYDSQNRKSISSDGVRAISEDKDGSLWVATIDGLNRMDFQQGSFTRFRHSGTQPSSLSNNDVISLLIDHTGDLWVGTGDGLDRFQLGTGEFIHYKDEIGPPATLSGNAVITIGEFIHYKYDNSSPTKLSGNAITSIFEDRGGVIWVGTYGGGVKKYNREQSKFTYYRHEPQNPNSLSSNFVFSIHADNQGDVWVGTYGGGLNRFNPNLGQFTHFRHIPNDPDSLLSDEVTSVYKDRSGTLWVGTNIGISRLNPGSEIFTHYRPDQDDSNSLIGIPVYAIHEDRTGNLWFGTANGLDKFDVSNDTFFHYKADASQPNSLSSDFITSVFEDQNQNLWVGTFDNGLNRIILQDDTVIRYQHNPNLLQDLTHNSIMAIYQDSKNRLWVATAGGGLNGYNPEKDTFFHYTEKHGLPSNVIYGVLEDKDGNLWLSTNYGLSLFDPETETFRNYTTSDGLQSNEFNMSAYARSIDGRLYFGGINGLNIITPSEVEDSAYTPPIVFTSFTYKDRSKSEQIPAEYLDEVTLTWPNNNFSFEFAALSYAQSSKNQYAYMLENFDSSWNYIGTRREGSYANLPGGSYMLRVKGSNSDGVWNEIGSNVKITVIPPFWETWIFRSMLVFSLLALGLVVYGLRTRSIQIQNLQLERLVHERTGTLQKRTEELEALYSGGERIIRSLTLDQVFQAIVEVAVKMLHADRSVVFVWDEYKKQIIPNVNHGFKPETLQVLHFEKGEGTVGKAFETGEPIIVREVDFNMIKPDVRAAVAAEGIQSLLHIPIRVNEKTIGVFNVGFTRPDAVSNDTARLFTALVQRAALSIENMELFEQTKELAVVEERNRVARDLHDSAKQKAFAALAQLGVVNGVFKKDPETASTHLTEAENLVYEVIQELTFLIQEMYPMALKEKGLATTLRDYIFEWENRNGVMINLAIQNDRRMDLEKEQAIYRMVQEALANVARHSRSDDVDVTLDYQSDIVSVIVQDNGLGFDPSYQTGGMGLRIIKERAESIGGVACVESKPGDGTKVVITAPLNGQLERN